MGGAHEAVPPIAAGVNCYRRGVEALHEYFNSTGAWPSSVKVRLLEVYIELASEGVSDEEQGVCFAYDALIDMGLNDDATHFRKKFYKDVA